MNIFKLIRASNCQSSIASLVGAAALCISGMLAAPIASAVIGATDVTPAATLLLPYFEVDLNNPNGPQTSMRISNASASSGMVNITLWTDWGLPTKSFSLYFTGYDTVEVDLRLVFSGHIPRTADAGSDAGDKISPRGQYSQDINFPGNGPASAPPGLMSAFAVQSLRSAHIGVASPTFSGLCGAKAYGDGIARGYVTVDDLVQGLGEDEANPSTPGYAVNILGRRNIFLGSYTIINRSVKSILTDSMVHIEASLTDPLTATPGNPTFYSRFNPPLTNNIDSREPLNSVWDARYINGGVFSGGTRIRVWRDPVTNPSPVACGTQPSQFPLTMREIVAFDEQETVAISPLTGTRPLAGALNSFPIATQSVASAPLSPFSFGTLRLNFNDPGSAAPFAGSRQAHVSVVHSSSSYATNVPAVVIAPHRSAPGPSANRIGN